MCRGRNLIWLKMTVGLGLGDVSTGIINAKETVYHGSYLGVYSYSSSAFHTKILMYSTPGLFYVIFVCIATRVK